MSAQKCDRCNGHGRIEDWQRGVTLMCSECRGRGALFPVRPVDGMWENKTHMGDSKPNRLGAAFDEIFYKHHEGSDHD